MTNVKTFPRVTFGIIVLNGEPFLLYNLRALYPFAHQIIVVEGACVAASSLATPDGHSNDGTLETLRKFRSQEDTENKLLIVTAEDEGKPDGFWSEKDEMSQAYARRATGDWLWQVDSDEFYLEKDIETIFKMLQADPTISGISFPYLQFWGGFDYLEDGQWFRYDLPNFDRLFRWRQGYQYIDHRPPTVVDVQGRDMRTIKWVSHREMKRLRIYLYHYSYVLPHQAYQKTGYYTSVTWTDDFRNNERWLRDRYLRLGDPYHVGEGMNYFTWLVRYCGTHPSQITKLRQDIAANRVSVELRPTDDIEKLLASRSYQAGRWILGVFVMAKWMLINQPLRLVKRQVRGIVRKIGAGKIRNKFNILRKIGLRYWHIIGYADIPGWLSPAEAKTLYDLAKSLHNDHPVIVEIGSFLGQSSVLLGNGLHGKLEPTLYCIDPFNADGDDYSKSSYAGFEKTQAFSLRDQFNANLKKNGVSEVIQVLTGYSTDFAPSFKEEIDLLFIDGNHEYKAVLRDFQDWSPMLKPGGLIAFHDVVYEPKSKDDFPGPGLVVKQNILDNSNWREVQLVDSLLIARKKRA